MKVYCGYALKESSVKFKLKNFLAVALVLVIAVLGSIAYGWYGSTKLEHPVRIEVKKGSGVQSLSAQLKSAGLIKNEMLFKLYLRTHRLNPKITAGLFFFRGKINTAQVAAILTEGNKDDLKITIPEGRNRWEIFTLLNKKMAWLDSAEWNQISEDPAWLKKMGIEGSSVEGFLFPATYNFPHGIDERGIQEIMIRQFKKNWLSLDTTQSELFTSKGRLGVMTMASIVEEEAGVASERPEISGVFYNRLVQGIPLGADPTVRYIFKNMDGPILKSQLQSESPYNTRRFRGLPPGPISNPGLASLKAALKPNQTKMLYFVAKDDGSHQHYFAPSYEEHLKYCEDASANRKKAGRAAAAEY